MSNERPPDIFEETRFIPSDQRLEIIQPRNRGAELLATSGPDLVLLLTAFSKAQGRFTASPRSRKNPFFNSMYSTLEDIWSVARVPLAENELSWINFPTQSNEKEVTVNGLLAHSSGQWMLFSMTVPAIKEKRDGSEDYSGQTIASAMTYTKRQLMSAVMGIPADEDDDGNTAASSSPQAPPQRAAAPPATKQAPKPPPAQQKPATRKESAPPPPTQPPDEQHGPPPDDTPQEPENITAAQKKEIRHYQVDIMQWPGEYDFTRPCLMVSKNRVSKVEDLSYGEANEFIAGLKNRAIKEKKLNPDGSIPGEA